MIIADKMQEFMQFQYKGHNVVIWRPRRWEIWTQIDENNPSFRISEAKSLTRDANLVKRRIDAQEAP